MKLVKRAIVHPAATLAALASAGVVFTAAAPASADHRSDHCVTRDEFTQIGTGQSMNRVGDIFDHWGALSWKNGGWLARQYPTCTGGYAEVTFQWNANRQQWVSRYKYAEWY